MRADRGRAGRDARRRRGRCPARPAARHALRVDRRASTARRRPAARSRPRPQRSIGRCASPCSPTTARATTTSGRSAALLAAQRPEFAVTAGDNSYLVAAEVLLDRNIFRPLGELIGNAPMYVCLGDHDKFFPGPGAISKAFDLPDGGRFAVQPRADPGRRPRRRAQRARRPSRSRARRCASPARPSASSPATVPCRSAIRSCRVLRETGATRLLGPPAPLRAPDRRGRADVHGRHRRPGPRLARPHQADAGSRRQPARHRRAAASTCAPTAIGYTYLDKHGRVLDHVVI